MNNWGLVVDNWSLVVDWGSVVRGGLCEMLVVCRNRGFVVHGSSSVVNWGFVVDGSLVVNWGSVVLFNMSGLRMFCVVLFSLLVGLLLVMSLLSLVLDNGGRHLMFLLCHEFLEERLGHFNILRMLC